MPKSRQRLQRQLWKNLVSLALAGAMLPGCAQTNRQVSYLGDPGNVDIQDHVQEIDHSTVEEPSPDVVMATTKPRRLGDRSQDEVWDLSLAEAIHLALVNNKILRARADFRTTASGVMTNAVLVSSTIDPAIQDSGFLFGNRGVEAALSQFDPIFNLQSVWGSNTSIVNNGFSSGGVVIPGSPLNLDTNAFSAGVTKNFGYGANLSIAQNVNYLYSNAAGQLFPSVYTGNLQLQYTQPLLAGAGAEFNRIAGPFNAGLAGVSGVSNGVIISRINTDISVADFEMQVRNMLRDVEETYWDLYLAYRTHDANVDARNSFLRSWRFAQANKGAGKFSDLDELQARQAYFQGRSTAQDSLQNLYNLETQLRRMCGLPSADGRIIRPADEPSVGEFIPDWNVCLAEALTRREELRRQKWNIKSLELQLRAAQNLVRPQLNFISSYQLNGFGNNLFDIKGSPTPGAGGADLQSYFQTQYAGNQTGFTAGFQFNMPLGFRYAHSQVRNYELRVGKAKEVLAQQELEICHELTTTFQNLAWRYQTAQTNYNRWQVAEAQVSGRENRYRTGVPLIDTSVLLQQWLTTRTDAATSQIAYYTSVIEYQKAITDLNYRKGSLLEMNNVHLAEATWTPEAYNDAIRRAWSRSFAFDALDADPLRTEPEVFERPNAVPAVDFNFEGNPYEGMPPTAPADAVPAEPASLQPVAPPTGAPDSPPATAVPEIAPESP